MCSKFGNILIMLFVVGSLRPLKGVSLDGTASVQYQAASYPFANGDFARGFVWLNGGFSIGAGGTITMNVARVAGPIDMNNTGTILLEGDLPLFSNVSLSAGGIIDGQGNAVLMGGDLSVPAGTTLEFASDTIIDGQGKTLVLEDGAPGGRLLINGASGTRVTLRNMTIRGVKNYGGVPAITFGASANQVLVLDNVTLHLDDDYLFVGGALEILNVVTITGQFKPEFRPELVPVNFVYLSLNNLTIRNDSMLFIDTSIALIYAPIDGSPLHLVMSGPASRLFLNGGTLFVPQTTGLRLIRGQLTIDHNTFLQGDGLTSFTSPIRFGDGNQTRDLAIDFLPGAQLQVVDTLLSYQNQA